MKERPILFSAPMVRALLDGSKTQTRRIMKPQPEPIPKDCEHGDPGVWIPFNAARSMVRNKEMIYACPYGAKRDRLIVKETWRYAGFTEDGEPIIQYRADGEVAICLPSEDWADRVNDIWAELSDPENYDIDNSAADRKWRPSIFMPLWASRLTLEIVSVRVERLQDISEADAKAEGATPSIVGTDLDHLKYRAGYMALWEQINGAGSWALNPWVWVVEFKKVPA